MNYIIINGGGSRDVFVDGKRFFIYRHERFPTTNLKFAKEAAKLPFITYEVVGSEKEIDSEAAQVANEKRALKREVPDGAGGFVKKILKKIAI